MPWLKSILQNILSVWTRFWFDSRSDDELVILSVFRLVFCLVMFFCYVARMQDVEFFFSFNGIMPLWHVKTIEYFRYHPTIIADSWSLGSIQALHGLLLVFLLLGALGLFTRVSLIGAYFLHMMFYNRNMSAMFGVDMIATFFFLYLCFADSNARFSLDAKIGRGAKKQSTRSHIAFRLMQLQICIIYGFSGMEKLKGMRWWDGSALWDVLSMGVMQRWDMSFVAHFPVVLSAAVYVVLAFEVYFPVLIWQKSWRLPLLVFGCFMHIGIFVFMNLPSFGFMMISLYVLFLTKKEILDGVRALLRFLRINRPIHN